VHVHFQSTVVVNESSFPESIHKKIGPWASGADHFRQNLLAHLGNSSDSPAFPEVG
jgi:hypothetical protein